MSDQLTIRDLQSELAKLEELIETSSPENAALLRRDARAVEAVLEAAVLRVVHAAFAPVGSPFGAPRTADW